MGGRGEVIVNMKECLEGGNGRTSRVKKDVATDVEGESGIG